MPRQVNIATTRERIAYMRGQVDQGAWLSNDHAKAVLVMLEQLLDLVEQYQAEGQQASVK